MGPSLKVCLKVARTNCNEAVVRDSRHVMPSGKSFAIPFVSLPSTNSSSSPRPATLATIGPIKIAPRILSAILLPPINGMNTRTTIIKAGKFIVEEPWVIATVVSTDAPRLRKAVAIGTMQAEHRFITGPIIKPLKTPFTPLPSKRSRISAGKRKASVMPAITKAKVIPIHTRFK